MLLLSEGLDATVAELYFFECDLLKLDPFFTLYRLCPLFFVQLNKFRQDEIIEMQRLHFYCRFLTVHYGNIIEVDKEFCCSELSLWSKVCQIRSD